MRGFGTFLIWPAGRDSNPRSSESESAALSNCATGGCLKCRTIEKHSPKQVLSLVPEAGVEPARYRYHRILSPARLPIPSFRHMQNGVCRAANTLLKQYTLFNVKMQHFFFAKDGFLRRYPAVFYRQLSKTMKFFNGVMKRKSDG